MRYLYISHITPLHLAACVKTRTRETVTHTYIYIHIYQVTLKIEGVSFSGLRPLVDDWE